LSTRRTILKSALAIFSTSASLCALAPATEAAGKFPLALTEDEWRAKLTPEQYNVLRESGTERPFTSPLNDEHRRGTFTCAGCEQALFSSTTKFESGTGWPSFWAPLEGGLANEVDNSFGMARTSVHCARCGGHLGHVFNDGPAPSGLRYCMNGVAMSFHPTG
jgi:peptide-methionine (R)-S-oxide reductase